MYVRIDLRVLMYVEVSSLSPTLLVLYVCIPLCDHTILYIVPDHTKKYLMTTLKLHLELPGAANSAASPKSQA